MRRFVHSLVVLALAAASYAAPIRVGILKGTSTDQFRGRNLHTSINTAATAIASILARPDSANLGPNLVVPAVGFQISIFGPDSVGRGAPVIWAPTAPQFETFFKALDSLDVLWIPNYSLIATSITDSVQRKKLETFIRTKGFVSTHNGTSSDGRWPAWDSIHGARLENWISTERLATLHLDTVSKGDPDLRFLNRGQPDTARYLEEWISFTTNGDVIRAKTGLKVTVNLDEASVSGGMVQARAMGDHPVSWLRRFPEGGQFFYTALGHRSSSYLGTILVNSVTGDTTDQVSHYLRRQLYNAIMWAAGVDSNGVVSVKDAASKNVSKFSDAARIANHGGTLAVSILQNGAHTVEIRALDGALIASRRGTGRVDHRIQNLRPGVYTVSVSTNGQKLARLVTIP